MNDTPEHIRELQLKIWMAKPPMERLLQFLKDNGELFQFWNSNKAALEQENGRKKLDVENDS